MEIYSSEEQQVEAIKNFWKENGTNIIVGAVLGLAGFSGWNWYVDKQISEKEAASAQYETLVKVAGVEGVKLEAVTSELDQFVAAHGESGYTIFAQLIAAKQAVTEGQFEQAEKSLSAALAKTEDAGLKDLISVRLARVQVELKKYDAAISQLSMVQSAGYKNLVSELKGDVYLAQGELDKARMAYQAAADNDGLEGNNLLKMKLNDLALSSQTNS